MKWCFVVHVFSVPFARTESHSDVRACLCARRFPNCTVIYCVMMINVRGSYCSLKYWHETPGKAPFIFVSLFMSHDITAGLEILCWSCYETMRIWAVELFKTFHHMLIDIRYSCIWNSLSRRSFLLIYIYTHMSLVPQLLHGLKRLFVRQQCFKWQMTFKIQIYFM